jgi:hypothetical protein
VEPADADPVPPCGASRAGPYASVSSESPAHAAGRKTSSHGEGYLLFLYLFLDYRETAF